MHRKRSGSAGSMNGGELQLSRPPSSGRRTPNDSPRMTRKSRAKSPVSSRPNLLNGIGPAHHNGNGHAKINGQSHSQSHAPTDLMSKYNIGKVIGAGNFATVKECSSKETSKQFALKIIDKSRCQGKEQMIENEVSILRRVKHENIIQLIEEFDTVSELYLVMELVNGGDFFDAISDSTKYTERDASGMLYNLMSAVNYLHDLHIVHRDIKPENILMCEHLDGSKSLKLGDFGLATEVDGPLFTVCGTPTYVAPEIIAENGYSFKVDIWSSGVITYILLCGFPPFVSTTHNQEELFDQILAGTFEYTAPFWDDISDSAKELISNMLQVDPEERFSATEVIDHPWVADDAAKDEDFHDKITDKLTQSFERKVPAKDRNAGVAVIAATALDKESRFFHGRKNPQLHGYNSQDSHNAEDEVF